MVSQHMQTDIVVIGGGMAGLSAACYLARAGVDVTLFEKSSKLGGRAATQNHEGFHFNRGIHALYTGGAAEQVLQELGILYSGQSPKDVFILRQGRLYPFPTSLPTLLRTGLFNLEDKIELGRLLSSIPHLEPQKQAHVSIEQWLDRTVHRPRVRQFMTTFACTNVYSAALDVVSAEVLITKLQLSLKHPVLYLDGGWQTLVDGLRTAAEQAGAHITSGARVEAVDYHNSLVQGIRLYDGSMLHTSAVIIATAPQEAAKLLDEGSYAPLNQIVDTLIPAEVACLDVALNRLPDPQHAIVQDLEHPRFMSTQSIYAHIAPEG